MSEASMYSIKSVSTPVVLPPPAVIRETQQMRTLRQLKALGQDPVAAFLNAEAKHHKPKLPKEKDMMATKAELAREADAAAAIDAIKRGVSSAAEIRADLAWGECRTRTALLLLIDSGRVEIVGKNRRTGSYRYGVTE